MGKRKIIVESITKYIFSHQQKDGTIFSGSFDINGNYNTATVEIRSKTNSGGEAWDWAQSHWDEFIPEVGPPVTLDLGDGETLTIPSTLRWACVQGVYDTKMKHLPIEEVRYQTGKNKGYAKAKKKARGKTTPKYKIQPEPEGTPLRGVSQKSQAKTANKATRKPKPQLTEVEKLTEGTDVESVKQEKIRKVMEEDDA